METQEIILNYLKNQPNQTSKEIFEKALFALVLISYIQAFSYGNKRLARITANAL